MGRGSKKRSRKNSQPGQSAQPRQQPARSAGTPPAPSGNGDAPNDAPATPSRSQAQKRAEHALGRIEAIREDDYGNYASYVKALPARIIMNGLGQALAMERASGKKDKGHELLYQHMDSWLRTGWEHSPYQQNADILAAIVTGSEADYIRTQGEAMAYLEWLKKFAAAFLKDQEGENATAAG